MPQTLTFGLFSLNSGACSYPAAAARVAQAAEAAGFDSLWAGEHVVLPDPRVPPSPLAPEERILDPIVTLTFLAAQTERVLLGTGIIILPQRIRARSVCGEHRNYADWAHLIFVV